MSARRCSLLEIEATTADGIGELAAAISAGAVKTLFMLGGNPAYNAPADLDWTALQSKVGEVVRFGYHEDETAEGRPGISRRPTISSRGAMHARSTARCSRAADDRAAVQWPDGNRGPRPASSREATPDAYAQVVATLQHVRRMATSKKRFANFCSTACSPVPRGQGGAAAIDTDVARQFGRKRASRGRSRASSNLEVRFVTDHKVDDGRFVNNGWLQECPDPITKLTWDNAILHQPAPGDVARHRRGRFRAADHSQEPERNPERPRDPRRGRGDDRQRQ